MEQSGKLDKLDLNTTLAKPGVLISELSQYKAFLLTYLSWCTA